MKPLNRIIGIGLTNPTIKGGLGASHLMGIALNRAMDDALINQSELDGLLAMPSLSEPRFMQAHYLATTLKLLPKKGFFAKTIDTGGAGPVSGLLEANRLLQSDYGDVIAVVAGDAVSSLATDEFLRRANSACEDESGDQAFSGPVIPLSYNRIAEWYLQNGWVTREQLAMVSVLMSIQASNHPLAVSRVPLTLDSVLNSKSIGSATTIMECALRVDGAAAIIIASDRFIEKLKRNQNTNATSQRIKKYEKAPIIMGGGEGSGPLFPPEKISEDMFSCDTAAQLAFNASKLSINDIQFFGLYDCFPICFIMALESVGLAPKHGGGKYVEKMYNLSESKRLSKEPLLIANEFPINTHGGLLSFGAPWETPAMYNIIEAVEQLNHFAGIRQVSGVKNALVYGNGGIFSASAVAILSKYEY